MGRKPRGPACDHSTYPPVGVSGATHAGLPASVTRSYSWPHEPARSSSRESRDPIGYAVAAMNRLAQSDLLDRLGIRKQTEKAVFTVTRSGFRTATTAGPRLRPRRPGAAAPAPARARPAVAGVFDLTPTDDEQMLVDVVTELATEVVRPAAADADAACATPAEVLRAGNEIGLPILGVPESLGGLSDERTAMAGTLVAEALAKGDLGIAVAALAPGSVATAISLWGTDEQQATYLPAFTGDEPAGRRGARADRAERALRRARARDHATRTDDGYRPRRRQVARARAAPTPSCSSSAPGSTTAPTRCSSSRPAPPGSSVEADPAMGVRAASLDPARRSTGVERPGGAPCSGATTARRTPSACGSRGSPGARWRSAPARPCSTT